MLTSFTTLALANMLSELRKYRIGFTIAHQYLHQLTPEIGRDPRCLWVERVEHQVAKFRDVSHAPTIRPTHAPKPIEA